MATDERNNSPVTIFFFLTGPGVNKRDNCGIIVDKMARFIYIYGMSKKNFSRGGSENAVR